jgi:DNA gyrase/topoisomerase IV subunit B
MTQASKTVYDESKIRTLSSLEHIQARPGMYIGRLGNGDDPDDGIYVLLKEVVDNSVDEFIMGHGKKIDISFAEEGFVRVRDYGRGIPLGKVVECVSRINTGGKYNDDVFQFSVGLNGVGLKAVNALSSSFVVTSCREGKFKRATFADGVLLSEEDGDTDEPNGTEITFCPGAQYFGEYHFDDSLIRRRLASYAYLNTGLSLYFNGERFFSKNGLRDLLDDKVDGERLYDIVYHRAERLEFAFCHSPGFGESYYSFVNGQYTNDGGTHQSAFREGILKGVNEFAGKTLNGNDVRNGIVGAVAIKLKSPIFESQTKNKLGNAEVRSDVVGQVKDAVASYLYKNPEVAEAILNKTTQNERLRKEIQNVKKQAKDREKKTQLKIPKLRDCKYHLNDARPKKGDFLGENSMIFLTEGQSAAGSLISCRDVDTQAVFSLKGKPLNVLGHRQETVYKNEELYFIMQSLGIEDGLDNLRYQKVIIATDADVDGAHIRILLITFFLTFFEQLVHSGHLFILETPLFRARNKKETVYCYNEAERDQAVARLGSKSAEVTRFKGLGEISPKEFGQFIGDDIRLRKVSVDSQRVVPRLLEFFMGKNTPKRRSYIMDHLLEI